MWDYICEVGGGSGGGEVGRPLWQRGRGRTRRKRRRRGSGVGSGRTSRSTARSDFKHARGSLQERSNSGRQSSSCASAFKSVPASAAAAEEGTTCCRWLFFLNRVLCPAGRALSTRTGRRWITHFSRFRHCAAFQSGAQRSGVGPGALRLPAPSEDSRIFSVCVQSTNNAQRDPLSFKIDTVEHKHTHPVFFLLTGFGLNPLFLYDHVWMVDICWRSGWDPHRPPWDSRLVFLVSFHQATCPPVLLVT